MRDANGRFIPRSREEPTVEPPLPSPENSPQMAPADIPTTPGSSSQPPQQQPQSTDITAAMSNFGKTMSSSMGEMSEKMDNNFGQLLGALRALAQPTPPPATQQAPPIPTMPSPPPQMHNMPPAVTLRAYPNSNVFYTKPLFWYDTAPTSSFTNPPFAQTPPSATETPPFIPPATSNPAAGASSILTCFPEIESSILLSVIKHELRPQQLHKLITSTNVKQLNPNSLFITTDGLQVAEASLSRELPSFALFIRTLTVYLDILTNHVTLTTNNAAMVCHIAHGGFFYLKMLNYYSSIYTYKAILDFHMVFHAKRLREMEQGNYSGWSKIDSNAVAEFLQGSIVVAQLAAARSGASSKSKSRSSAPRQDEVCKNFNDERCASPCRHNRLHKCSSCNLDAHGRSTCSAKQA
ncbi:hypothetical protein CCMSSC00406_0005342 [Pleurotus cornucopiae]|uniref:Uncharacterized protein n=1 Tax=Pleurotus cornucopiae TaxID=5321 RepID=A0ACB7IPK1_PLECO|nr:hypothetical protein CCMSSC00406_0005342 [Pleurotus cornucopiae]